MTFDEAVKLVLKQHSGKAFITINEAAELICEALDTLPKAADTGETTS